MIYIVRHADRETGDFYNDKLRHQDSPINLEGKEKAKKLCDYFANKQIKKIYISEYVRTRQTARYLADHLGLEPVVDKRLNEIDNGVIEPMGNDEIRSRYPEFYNDFFSYSKDVRFPEGETGEEVKARQKALLDELVQSDENIVMFSHEGYIRLLMCHLTGLPVYRRHLFKVDFCGIVAFEYDRRLEAWKIHKFNQTAG